VFLLDIFCSVDFVTTMSLDIAKLNDLKVPELKEHLTARGLETKGKKAELVTRLTAALEKEKAASSGSSSKDESADVDVTDIGEEKKEAEKTPATGKSASTARKAAAPSSSDSSDQATKDVTVSATVSDTDRKKVRADRFQIPVVSSQDEKLASRAARFGTTASSNGSAPARSFGAGLTSEKLKERAQRFGIPVKDASAASSASASPSSAAAAPTSNQRMQQRASRFAESGVGRASPNLVWSAADEERKRKRAERFSALPTTQEEGGGEKKQKTE